MAAANLLVIQLAEQLLRTLRDRRAAGATEYPLTLLHLLYAAAPESPEDRRKKAIRSPAFTAHVILAQKKHADTPLALIEDRDALASSPLLLEWLLEQICTPANPTIALDKLAKKPDARLRSAFEQSLRARVTENRLPDSVAAIELRRKPHLYLRRMPPPPPPRPPAVVVAELLTQALRNRRESGLGYPTSITELVEQTVSSADRKQVGKALKTREFADAVLLSAGKKLEAPAALADDRVLLLRSPALLDFALKSACSEQNQAAQVADLKKKVDKGLESEFSRMLEERILRRDLPAGFGLLIIKKKPYLFRLDDVLRAAPPVPTPEPAPAAPQVAPPSFDFAPTFDEAFARLDREAGWVNFVSLVELRRALPCDRDTFDGGLNELRRAGKYTLSAAEGREGLTPEEQEASIREQETLMLFVARRSG